MPASGRCCPLISRSACRNRSSWLGLRSRSGSFCRGVAQGRRASTATPVDGGAAYELDGVKLWTTNGVVAELLVVMATVPKSDGHRGGISAFVVAADSPGITVERRNKFMGLRGIENGLTRL